MVRQIHLRKTWLTDNNVIWKLFVHLQQNQKFFSLDGPAAGMSTRNGWVFAHIRQIQKDSQITIILIEHDMSLVAGCY